MFSSSLDEKLNIKSTNINIIKFFCAIAVIISHQSSITSGEEDFLIRFNHGQCNLGGIAVAVFFFLSGLYVAKSLNGSDKIADYIVKRIKRIFPQLWIVVFFSIVLGSIITSLGVFDYYKNVETYKYLLNCLLIPTHNLPGVFVGLPYQTVNGPLWTLPVEFFAYICLAILTLFSRLIFPDKNKEKRKIFDVISLGIIAIILMGAGFALGTDNMAFIAIRPFLIFFEGVVFYDFRKKIKLSPVIGAIALVLTGLLLFTPFFNIGLILFAPYAFISLVLGIPQIKADWKIFMISYEMYLVGWPIQQVIRYCYIYKMNPYLSCLLAIPIDLIIGFVIYIVVESIINRKVSKKK